MKKFVVEHAAIGNFRRGDVVTEEQLARQGMSVDRLLGLRSMRSAIGLECDQSHVDLADSPRSTSFQHQLAEKDQIIASLESRIHELESEKLMRGAPGVTKPSDASKAVDAVVVEKDRTIMDLQTRLREAQKGNLESVNQAQVQAQPQQPAPAPVTPQGQPTVVKVNPAPARSENLPK